MYKTLYEESIRQKVEKNLEHLETSESMIIHRKNDFLCGGYTKEERDVIRSVVLPYYVHFTLPWYTTGAEDGPACAYLIPRKRTILDKIWENTLQIPYEKFWNGWVFK